MRFVDGDGDGDGNLSQDVTVGFRTRLIGWVVHGSSYYSTVRTWPRARLATRRPPPRVGSGHDEVTELLA